MQGMIARAISSVIRTRLRLWGLVCTIAVLFGLFDFAVSRWLLAVHIAPGLLCAIQAAIIGLVAGYALCLILLGYRERRRIVLDELRRVAELNHSVRNSLELISLANYAQSYCEQHRAIIVECTNRIDQTLKELFPMFGKTEHRKKNSQSAKAA
jgi:hypothetical protein